MIELKGDFDFGASRCFFRMALGLAARRQESGELSAYDGSYSKPHTKRFALNSLS